MADTRAYFKQHRLGDFLLGFPTVRVPLSAIPSTAPGLAASVVQHPVGRGTTYHYIVKAALRRGHYDSTESVRAFHLRKIALARDIAAMSGYASGSYTPWGPLVLIQDPDTDTGIAVQAPSIGTSVPCEIAAPIAGLAVNDYVYLRTATQYDVAKVTALVAGGTMLTLDIVNNTYADGVEVFRAHWVAPIVGIQQAPDLGGNDSTRDRQVLTDLDFTFEGPDDPWSGA